VTWDHVCQVRELPVAHLPKVLLYALAARANADGDAWPAIRTLCRDTGLSRRAVQKHLNAVIGMQGLSRHPRPGQVSRLRLTLDRIVLPGHTQGHPTGGKLEPGCARHAHPPCTMCASPAHVVHSPCACGAPEVLKEVLVEEEKKKEAAAPAAGDKSTHDDGAWWRSRKRVSEMGEALGVTPRPGERYAEYKDRVFRRWQASRSSRPSGSNPESK